MKGFDHPDTTKTWDALYYSDTPALAFYDNAIRTVIGALQPRTGERILDAGCGAGVHAIRVAKAGYPVDAIDFSQEALNDATRRAEEAGVGNQIRFSLADLTKLDMPDGCYSKIFSWGVLIHIPEIEKALDGLVRILAPGGRLVLYVSNEQGLLPHATRFRRWLTGRPPLDRRPLGLGTRVDFQGDSIWVWYNDIDAIVEYLGHRGLRLLDRQPGEFWDMHLRFSGMLRTAALRVNNFWFNHHWPARHALMNMLVFEKTTNRSA